MAPKKAAPNTAKSSAAKTKTSAAATKTKTAVDKKVAKKVKVAKAAADKSRAQEQGRKTIQDAMEGASGRLAQITDAGTADAVLFPVDRAKETLDTLPSGKAAPRKRYSLSVPNEDGSATSYTVGRDAEDDALFDSYPKEVARSGKKKAESVAPEQVHGAPRSTQTSSPNKPGFVDLSGVVGARNARRKQKKENLAKSREEKKSQSQPKGTTQADVSFSQAVLDKMDAHSPKTDLVNEKGKRVKFSEAIKHPDGVQSHKKMLRAGGEYSALYNDILDESTEEHPTTGDPSAVTPAQSELEVEVGVKDSKGKTTQASKTISEVRGMARSNSDTEARQIEQHTHPSMEFDPAKRGEVGEHHEALMALATIADAVGKGLDAGRSLTHRELDRLHAQLGRSGGVKKHPVIQAMKAGDPHALDRHAEALGLPTGMHPTQLANHARESAFQLRQAAFHHEGTDAEGAVGGAVRASEVLAQHRAAAARVRKGIPAESLGTTNFSGPKGEMTDLDEQLRTDETRRIRTFPGSIAYSSTASKKTWPGAGSLADAVTVAADSIPPTKSQVATKNTLGTWTEANAGSFPPKVAAPGTDRLLEKMNSEPLPEVPTGPKADPNIPLRERDAALGARASFRDLHPSAKTVISDEDGQGWTTGREKEHARTRAVAERITSDGPPDDGPTLGLSADSASELLAKHKEAVKARLRSKLYGDSLPVDAPAGPAAAPIRMQDLRKADGKPKSDVEMAEVMANPTSEPSSTYTARKSIAGANEATARNERWQRTGKRQP